MRTVTFSDPAVVKLMGEHFVCAWVNKKPDVKFRDGLYPSSLRLAVSNGEGVDNVTSVIASTDGTVIHAMPGYLDVPSLTRHIAFARKLEARMFAPNVKTIERGAIYEDAHGHASVQTKILLERLTHILLGRHFQTVDSMPLNQFDRLRPSR